jgi:hypothetical protein
MIQLIQRPFSKISQNQIGRNSKWPINSFLLRGMLNSGRTIVIPLAIEFIVNLMIYFVSLNKKKWS